MQKFILSLDQGTTSSRVILYNTNFKPLNINEFVVSITIIFIENTSQETY